MGIERKQELPGDDTMRPADETQALLTDRDSAALDIVMPSRKQDFFVQLLLPSSPSTFSFMAPPDFDAVVGTRSGHILLCSMNPQEYTLDTVELTRLGNDRISTAFAPSQDYLVALSGSGEIRILHRKTPKTWEQVFQNSTEEPIRGCFPLHPNCLAVRTKHERIGTIELSEGQAIEMNVFSVPDHEIRELKPLAGSKVVALTRKGKLLVIDNLAAPERIAILPSEQGHHMDLLHRLSESSFLVTRSANGLFQHWRYSEADGWSSSNLQFSSNAVQLLACRREALLIRDESTLIFAERREGQWQKRVLDRNCRAIAAAAVGDESFVVGSFRGDVTVFSRIDADRWRREDLLPHESMVAMVHNSDVHGFFTGSYDYTLRWWLKEYANVP